MTQLILIRPSRKLNVGLEFLSFIHPFALIWEAEPRQGEETGELFPSILPRIIKEREERIIKEREEIRSERSPYICLYLEL